MVRRRVRGGWRIISRGGVRVTSTSGFTRRVLGAGSVNGIRGSGLCIAFGFSYWAGE